MKNLLLASVAVACVAITPGFASSPSENTGAVNVSQNNIILQMLADSEGGGDDGADHDSNDDQGGNSGKDDDDNDSDDDDDDVNSNKSDNGSGRKKPRVPRGSGCDSARDRAEHPGCNAG